MNSIPSSLRALLGPFALLCGVTIGLGSTACSSPEESAGSVDQGVLPDMSTKNKPPIADPGENFDAILGELVRSMAR